MTKKRTIINILDFIFVTLTWISAAIGIIWSTVVEKGYPSVIFYFTYQSNLFMLLAAFVYFIFYIFFFIKGKEIPDLLVFIRYVATSGILLTFFTVVCYLTFIYDNQTLFGTHCLYLHLLAPLFAFIGFAFFDIKKRIAFKKIWMSVIPTANYSIFYAICVFNTNDIAYEVYHFVLLEGTTTLSIGKALLSFVLMITASFIVGLLIWFINSKFYKIWNTCD